MDKKQNKKNSSSKKKTKIKEQNKSTLEGVISVSSRGVGYLPIPNQEEDAEIPEHNLNTALHGDRVQYIIYPRSKKQPRTQGEVTKILQRNKTELVGTLEIKKKLCFLIPDDRRVYRDIFITEPPTAEKNGQKAMVKITEWNNPHKNPEGEIVKYLGPKGEHEVEMNAIIMEKGFRVEFPEQVRREADKLDHGSPISKEEIAERHDMRDRLTLTIDPASAKDFDDALSIHRISKQETEVGIHIADVSHFVASDSAIDQEARRRGTSVYLVDRTIPMLPEILSNDLCSLNPQEDRLAFSAVLTLNSQAQVTKKWFGKTVIHSDQRYSYHQAQQEIDKGEGQIADSLRSLNDLAKLLRKQKAQAGAIDFETDEVEFELDDQGKPVRVFLKERLEAHQLIEEFMLLANRQVAAFLRSDDTSTRKDPVIYRVHDRPNPEKLEELFIFMRAMGYEIEVNPEEVGPKDINALLNKVTGQAEESLVKKAALRSMSKAVYSTKNIGHFGLAFGYYTHFTSPIRRYPDLMIHRLLQQKLEKQKIPEDQLTALQNIAEECTEKEIRAEQAERESIRLKQVEFMQDHLGETFSAVISGVTEWGFYVEEQSTRSSGLVHVSSLDNDYFELDEDSYTLIGRDTGIAYRLGDEIKVKLTDADPDARQLSFIPA